MLRKFLRLIWLLEIIAATVFVLFAAYAAYGVWLYFLPK